jgi:SnoaL-like domain
MTIEELLAREEIRCLLAKYTVAGDRLDFRTLGSVFAADGIMESGVVNAVGPEDIAAKLTVLVSDVDGRKSTHAMTFSRHNLTTSLINFENETSATGRTYFLVISDVGIDHSGVYFDRFIKLDGEWKIKHRRIRIDYCGPGGHAPMTR